MTAGSAVAGIVDRGGGLRVVVTECCRMRFHVGPGERLFVVPGLRVREPVQDVAGIVGLVRRYVASQGVPL